MLWSNSTIVSWGQSFLRISSRVTTSPGCSSSIFENLEGLFLKEDLAAVLVQFSGLEVQLEGLEANRVTSHGGHRISKLLVLV
jgi:hypothetical protein